MKQKILIVEDLFIEANDLEIMLVKAGYQVTGIANSVTSALQQIEQQKPNLVLVDIFLKGDRTGIDLAEILQEKDIPFIYISANSNHEVLMAAKATRPHGFIVKPFREKDLIVTLEIAQYRHENSAEANMRKEDGLRSKLSTISSGEEGWEQRMLKLTGTLQSYIPFDYMEARFNTDSKARFISFLRLGFDEYQVIGVPELHEITKTSLKEIAALLAAPQVDPQLQIISGQDFSGMMVKPSLSKLVTEQFQMKSLLSFPIGIANGELFHLTFYSRRPDVYKREHTVLLRTFRNSMSETIERMLSIERKPVSASLVSKQPIATNAPEYEMFNGIVGKSHLLLGVFDHISQVAPVNTSVLILGESGTGKERIAQCIHDLSQRSKHPMVRINCAALPPNLIESELFGHEKGAFTGATDKRIGKFELADNGTIFLDEIGEMPLELQSKLLRVLQEKEVERIGGRAPIKVDVRIIAATNRDLEKEVAAGRFRLDLYYRLNIFPITLPPLRDRKEDIPLLADHFIQIFNSKTGKAVAGISKEALAEALAYSWPGNIRELENIIERNVVLAKDREIKRLQLPVVSANTSSPTSPSSDAGFLTSEDNEREHIMRALRKCKGKVWGAGGAAELLDLPPSTLNSRMKKLGIKREFM